MKEGCPDSGKHERGTNRHVAAGRDNAAVRLFELWRIPKEIKSLACWINRDLAIYYVFVDLLHKIVDILRICPWLQWCVICHSQSVESWAGGPEQADEERNADASRNGYRSLGIRPARTKNSSPDQQRAENISKYFQFQSRNWNENLPKILYIKIHHETMKAHKTSVGAVNSHVRFYIVILIHIAFKYI